eukprot:TRINITY_DN20645_c0_g1_i2.p2 TRINITY_DN20645_c0_g1~~TRINITY_DN20645_c0_g1_i2.p2  ORF type:complete len:124 (+),score=31.92 TRINITY_DN20645_c0_g1_i2:2-373(+)
MDVCGLESPCVWLMRAEGDCCVCSEWQNFLCVRGSQLLFFFFSSRRRHTRCREVSWARRCVQETGSIDDEIEISLSIKKLGRSEISGITYDDNEAVDISDIDEICEEEESLYCGGCILSLIHI